MRAILFLVTLSACGPKAGPSLPALAEMDPRPADCTLDLMELRDTLSTEQPWGATRVERRRGDRVVETFTLRGGTAVRVVQTGCHHYGVVFQFGRVDAFDDPYGSAVELMSKLTKDGQPPYILGHLMRAGALEPDGSFACGGETTCDVVVENADGVHVLQVRSDFAM